LQSGGTTDAPIVHIGKVIRNAVAFNTQHWQGARPDVDHLLDNDIATLMFYYTPDVQEILDELTPFVSPQDKSTIQDVITDLERRIARMQRRDL
jgi:hypothetical protein